MKNLTGKFDGLTKLLEGLHDAELLKLNWCPQDSRLEIEVDDIQANFCGLPDYRGPIKAIFIFNQVTQFHLEVDLCLSGLMLYNWKLEMNKSSKYSSEIGFSPGGRIHIESGSINCLSEPQKGVALQKG